jgi:D-alanyl-D-alanine carboxypeptidase
LVLLLSVTTLAAASAGAGAAQDPPQGSVLVPASTTALRAGRDDKLRRLLKAIVAQSNAPGGVLVVQTPTGTWRRAMGAARLVHSVGGPAGARRRVPMRVTSRFRIASVTKTFTAALVLRLVADRLLSLDDSVEQRLPGRLPNGAGSQITIRDLLGHRSGLQNAGGDGPIFVAGPPGRFHYADANYTLLRETGTAVSGSAYADALAARILQPLGLKDTELATWAQVPAGLAHGYSVKRVSRKVPRLDFTTLANANDPAGAGLVSDADDLARFERALLTGQLIPSEFVALMKTPGRVEDSDTLGYNAYGLGMMRFSTACGAAWGHRGRPAGYTSYLLSTADGKRTVVLLINDNPEWPLNLKLNKLVTQALCT